MESPLTYILILLLNVFEFSSGVNTNHFSCSSNEVPTDKKIIKLFLTTGNLKVYCFFRSETTDSSRAILSVFTSGGIAPKLIIMNNTYHDHFHFKLSLFNNRALWLIDIPRENITVNTDIAAVEEWIIKVTMHEGLNIYNTEGTLLDLVREPILQWNLGTTLSKTHVQKLYPHVIDIKVTKCPCANDVALLGFILSSSSNGVFIGKTISGFWEYKETKWYDLTDNIYLHLKEEHKGLTMVDMVLTNHFLVILTSLGLFVSNDLRYPVSSHIQLSRADFCGFEMVDYIKGKLWYNEKCFANREKFEVDYVTITFDRNRTLSESSSCFYSKEPFLHWLPCLSSTFKNTSIFPDVITFLIDQESQTGIYLLHNRTSKQTFVSVSVLKDDKPNQTQPKFPNFKFPFSFSNPVGMVFHPRSHFLYVYGNQVWLSMDGGNSFELVCDFQHNTVRKTAHSFYTSDISFITQSGRIYKTKAGKEFSIWGCKFVLHVGQVRDVSCLKSMISILCLLVCFCRGGIAYIRKLLVHTNGPLGFHTSVLTDVIKPFGIDEYGSIGSYLVHGSLAISYSGNNLYHISITTKDVEKTVVIPGYSSFMITQILDVKNALSLATMPHKITSTLHFPARTWYLYNFSTSNGRDWSINLRPCNYLVQQDERNFISPNVVKYIDVGHEENYELKVMANTKGMRVLHVPPVSVVVGNPALLEVKTEGYFDITDSYHMKVHIASKFFRKGSTSLAVVVWESATQCSVTTLVPTMKSSCSYLRTMHHIPGRHIPPEDWISGVHKDSQGFNMIKTLPINYRPPSNMGISIPLTDNYYHADPSKPVPRNLFHKSKETGKYKQCAHARNREMCNCTEHQKFSHAVAFSDCKEKGSELFHFKVSVISGVTFCDLHEEFQIYVDEVPLPFPGHILIAVAASVVLGGLIFVAFIFQIKSTAHPSNTTISS
ncbi:Catsperb [Phodopus roborovskii]|uniref:Catsperb protein n=1 Tax=Phodopus roborovskii TaxID=109678 RepID=A0AAU9ZSV6_PHORO|nr:Catsperb [Phodopus roborovskii]